MTLVPTMSLRWNTDTGLLEQMHWRGNQQVWVPVPGAPPLPSGKRTQTFEDCAGYAVEAAKLTSLRSASED